MRLTHDSRPRRSRIRRIDGPVVGRPDRLGVALVRLADGVRRRQPASIVTDRVLSGGDDTSQAGSGTRPGILIEATSSLYRTPPHKTQKEPPPVECPGAVLSALIIWSIRRWQPAAVYSHENEEEPRSWRELPRRSTKRLTQEQSLLVLRRLHCLCREPICH